MGVSVLVGTDLVAVDEVQSSVDAFASRYLDRVFTPRELDDCRLTAGGHDSARLAARFAAKEATLKALRAGDTAVPWTAVEITNEPDGAPRVALTGPAAALAERAGVAGLAVSLSHERDLAIAVVVGETRP